MVFIFKRLGIPDVILVEPQLFSDNRGFFYEGFKEKEFNENGISVKFTQDNFSYSVKNVIRGLHYQNPKPQGKLVRVISGEIFDVAVDIRPDSETYGKWVSNYLSDKNKKQLWIPEGLAHGFLVTSDSAEFLYKTTDYWYPEYERSLIWNDATVGIQWPIDFQPQLAGKDAAGRVFADAEKFE